MNTIKSAASALRAHWSMKSQNRGRCIEIATAGLTGNPSWNHTTPDERESESLGRITSFTNAMTRESDIYWRLVELSIFKTHIECAEHAHSLLAIMIPDITEQLEKLRLASDIAPIGIPGKVGRWKKPPFFTTFRSPISTTMRNPGLQNTALNWTGVVNTTGIVLMTRHSRWDLQLWTRSSYVLLSGNVISMHGSQRRSST